jgi:hypothetical protein
MTGNLSQGALCFVCSDVLRRLKATASQPTLGATAHVTG